MIASADNQPNDRFGYSCYALVIPASQALIDLVAEVRQRSGMTRVAIPAHVTVKGTFVDIEDLDEIKRLVSAITAETPALYISFDGAAPVWWQAGGALGIPVSAPLQALHDRLVAAISPLGTAAYRDDPYQPHMTFVQDLSPEELEKAKDLISRIDFGPGFLADAVDLMGRVGPAYGGTWQRIEQFPLATSG